MDFEYELERLINEMDNQLMKICLDTGHSTYTSFDPVFFMHRHVDQIYYLHFKDTDPQVKKQVIENQICFYDAYAQGLFCNLGLGEVDFDEVRETLLQNVIRGWYTV